MIFIFLTNNSKTHWNSSFKTDGGFKTDWRTLFSNFKV